MEQKYLQELKEKLNLPLLPFRNQTYSPSMRCIKGDYGIQNGLKKSNVIYNLAGLSIVENNLFVPLHARHLSNEWLGHIKDNLNMLNENGNTGRIELAFEQDDNMNDSKTFLMNCFKSVLICIQKMTRTYPIKIWTDYMQLTALAIWSRLEDAIILLQEKSDDQHACNMAFTLMNEHKRLASQFFIGRYYGCLQYLCLHKCAVTFCRPIMFPNVFTNENKVLQFFKERFLILMKDSQFKFQEPLKLEIKAPFQSNVIGKIK